MASYRYLRDIKPEDLAPDEAREYSKKEKAANWWHYHWKTVAVAALCVLLAASLLRDVIFRGPEPDYTLTFVNPTGVPDAVCTAVQAALTPYADDRNGDGRVVLAVQSYTLAFGAADQQDDGTDPYLQMAGATQLSADFETCETQIFLLYDPAGFEQYTQGLLYVDGSMPPWDENTDPALLDWENMVFRWADCPVLAGLNIECELGIDCQQYLADYSIGRRGAWTDAAAQALAGSEVLWQALTAGAQAP